MDKYQKVAEQLQDAEIKVLKYLKKKNSSSVDYIAYSESLEPVAVGRAAMYLENKKLIKSNKITKKVVELDKLGREYSQSALPEFKFLKLVSVKSMSIDELSKIMGPDEVKFSLGYLKKKGLIDFHDGKIIATSAGAKYTESLESRFLGKLVHGAIELNLLSDEERFAYSELSRRRLIVRTVEKSEVFLEITELGEKVAEQKLPENLIGQLTPSLLKSGGLKERKFRRYDVEASVPKLFLGKKQAYLAFLDEVKTELASMGFIEENPGPLVEATFFNNDALFMPQDHSARGIHDIYLVNGKANLKSYSTYIKKVKDVHENGGYGSKGWGGNFSEDVTAQLVLRSHDTATSPRTLISEDLKIPGKYFTIARVFRPDQVDWKHLTEFNQLGGFILGEGLNFRQLLSLLTDFCKRVANAEEVKFVPGYFPFTEPSVECMIKINGVWVEAGGAGVFRPELCKPLGVDVPVIAWGFGVDRLFMARAGIKDIRMLFSSDLKWLREAQV